MFPTYRKSGMQINAGFCSWVRSSSRSNQETKGCHSPCKLTNLLLLVKSMLIILITDSQLIN